MFTKNQLLRGHQCMKALWLATYKRELCIEKGHKQAEEGIHVGELARDIFPGGILIPFSLKVEEMTRGTQQAMTQGEIIYEGTFVGDGMEIRCDILRPTGEGWEIYEVKSATEGKAHYLLDLAFQYNLLVSLGYSITKASLIYLNRDYVRKGELDLKQLFVMEDLTQEVQELRPNMQPLIQECKTTLEKKEEPCSEIVAECMKKDACEFLTYCLGELPKPSLLDVSGTYLSPKKKCELYHRGILSFEQLAQEKISQNGKMQIKCELENSVVLQKEKVEECLGDWEYPLYFLDFESYQVPIPPYDGLKPYQQICFQYSLHTLENEQAPLQHRSYLGRHEEDFIRKFAEQLILDLKEKGTIVVYNVGFEKTRVKELAAMYPDLALQLIKIGRRMQDLMIPFQKRYYYVKEMQGSYSIKYVLPALFPNDPELDYHTLNIQNGGMAMEAFPSLINKTPEETEIIRQDLLAYCYLDTLAMVKIWGKLKELIL